VVAVAIVVVVVVVVVVVGALSFLAQSSAYAVKCGVVYL